MTTEQGTTEVIAAPEETTEEAPAKPVDANAELRAYNKSLIDENKHLRGIAMKAELKEIGLKHDEGLGVAIAETFDGEITAEALSAFAEEKYRYKPSQAPPPPAVAIGDKVEQLAATGESLVPVEPPDEAAETTEKMHDAESGAPEAKASLNAKMEQFVSEHYPTE